MASMMRPYTPPNRFTSSPRCRTASPRTRPSFYTSSFSWRDRPQKVFMRIVHSGFTAVLVFLACVFTAPAQDLPSSAAPPASSPTASPSAAPAQNSGSLPPAALTLNDVLDRVVQREHMFMAQMRHMHPMVETYLQDLKNDSEGNAI